MHYNTIIVGSGAAGAILAARLTEDATRRVLLLEAGPDFAALDDLPEEIRYAFGRPHLWARAFGRATCFGWDYSARSTAKAEPIFVPRGKLAGGSTAVNAQIFLRGVPEDYDAWAAAGNDLWSFQALLPSFCKNERDLDYQTPFHGNDGPIPCWRFPREQWLAEHTAFYEAARSAGYADCPDHNDPDSTGVGPLAHNNVDGIRWSTAIGYLNPACGRPNLTIQADSLVHRVIFEGRRAVGVVVEQQGQLHNLYADEVILSGGAIGSPQLLLLSGIGPADHLRGLDIAVVQALPGVGQNLRDHPQILATMRTRPGVPLDAAAPRLQVGLRYTATGSNLRNDMFLLPSSYAAAGGVATVSDAIGFYLAACIYLAVGAGELKLTSTDPHVQPWIDYNYLTEEFDRSRLREAMRILLNLAEHPAYQAIIAERVTPTDDDLRSDAALDEWMLRTVSTSHHISSTCKMGPASDPMAVVDQLGRVYGVEGLRVADASIMPDCIRANTNITSMVIGERIAELMRLR